MVNVKAGLFVAVKAINIVPDSDAMDVNYMVTLVTNMHGFTKHNILLYIGSLAHKTY